MDGLDDFFKPKKNSGLQWTNGPFLIHPFSSRRKLHNQQDSDTTFTTPRCSVSTLERDNVAWPFEDHESKLSPRNTQ